MPPKKNIFLKAISLLQKKKEQQPVVQKTLQERAHERLQELGVDGHKRHFGDTINLGNTKQRQPAFTQFEKNKQFNEEEQINYISNPDNWLLVHATDYMPQNNSIQTTGMATNWAAPRSTVHFTLNHIVQSHMTGNWEGRPIVILSPYKDTVAKNGVPVGFALVDTYFSPDADQGLKLPKSARIVHPGNVPDGLLFQIKQNETIYKSDNYTEDEVQEILSLMSPKERQTYDNMLKGILDEQQLYDLLHTDYSGKVKKAYDSAKDKNAFLSGIMEEARYEMLTNFVKQMATHMTIERMGYHEITNTHDGGDVSTQAADKALEMGIQYADASNKGHGNSLYGTIEDIYEGIQVLIKEFSNANTKEQMQELFDTYADSGFFAKTLRLVSDSVMEKHPISPNSVYQIFDYYFKQYDTEQKNIQSFDKNLDITIKRYCNHQSKELNSLVVQLTKNPDFIKIAGQLYFKNHNMQNMYTNER